MIATPASTLHVLLYEGPAAEPLDPGLRLGLLSKLLDRGIRVEIIHAAELAGPEQSNPGHRRIFLGNFSEGDFPGSANDSGNNARSVSGLSIDEILALVDSWASSGNESAGARHWKPWFPVIDYSRCTNCMQCLSFCLFDVYGVTPEGQIQVQNETNCKTDCPACSRVCPEVAIMFPKYKAGPINGAAIDSEDVRREAMKVDISALLGGDIYALLRDRSAKAKSRFSKERDDDRALRERQRCLDKLKSTVDGLEIPAEVLASLPTMDQIQMKAEQARERALEALAHSAQSDTRPARTPGEQ